MSISYNYDGTVNTYNERSKLWKDLSPLPGGDRALELRSGIFLEYPKAKIEDTNPITFIPFYENPIISERKSARLVEYNPINRGSTLFSHVGADARSINIEFILSLAHIKSSWKSVLNTKKAFSNLEKKDSEMNRFFERFVSRSTENRRQDDSTNVIINRVHSVPSDAAPPASLAEGIASINVEGWESNSEEKLLNLAGPWKKYEVTHTETWDAKKTVLDSITFILGLIRTCVAGNAENSILGPPTLRLRHGLSYQDVPLLCKDYSIKVVEEAGYDMGTLLPLRIKISLSTVENRTGDFGKFNPGKAIKRDNLAGWEAVMKDDNINSTDPQRINS